MRTTAPNSHESVDSAVLRLPTSYWALVEQGARHWGDRTLLRDEAGRQVSFVEFRDAAEQVAVGLGALGMTRGSRICWQLPTGLEACVLMAALSRLACVQTPLVPILGPREVRFMTEQTRAEWLIVPGTRRGVDHEARAKEIAKDLGFQVLVLDALPKGGFDLSLPFGAPEAPPNSSLPVLPVGSDAETRWIYYTSGTTADPKGARHTDASIMASSNAFAHSGWYTNEDVLVVPIPMAHVGGVMLLGVLLRTGCTGALVEAFDPQRTPAFASECDATVVSGNTAVFLAYLDAHTRKGATPLLPRLKICSSGGSSRPAEVHERIRDELGGVGTMSGWGLSEFPAASAGRVDDSDGERARTDGRPAPGVELTVVGADERVCAHGIEGELRLRGPQLMQGYVDASLDADAFDSEGRLRSGDLGYVESTGHVRITGRLKDVIIRNGENISALEVEQALASHPGIRDVAVLGLPDARTGERCCAFIEVADIVIASGEGNPTVTEIAQHCLSTGLAKWKCPEQVEALEAIPRDGLGKIDKRGLRAQFLKDQEESK
jgi:cyclohexanecarboxylate-CoA ligase